MHTIYFDKETIHRSTIKDTCYALQCILDENEEDFTLSLKKDTYEFHTTYCTESYHYVTNNDHGLQKIAFHLNHKHHVVIDGNGSTFLFFGRIAPFFVEQCSHITLKNFTIEYQRPLYTQGEIVKATANAVWLKIERNEYPYTVHENGNLEFTGEGYASSWSWGMLEFDRTTGAPVHNAVDYFIKGGMNGSPIDSDLLQINYHFSPIPQVGNILVIKHEKRLIQAITLDRSKDITIEAVQILQCGSMAITAQFCENLDILKVCVTPNKAKGRVVSANADAIHCVGCRGLVQIEKSLFENQMDDALNIHGNYLLVDKVLAKNQIVAQIGHFQHFGIFDFEKGCHIEIAERDTFVPKATVTLKDKRIVNNQYIILTFNEEVLFDANKTYCIDIVDSYPTLIYRNNIVQNNRARGLLLKTWKKTLIENNIIHTNGAALMITADMNFWFESGKSLDVTIRKNDIRANTTSSWGKALIHIDPEIPHPLNGYYFMKTIVIEENTIAFNDFPLIFGQSIAKLIIKNNCFALPPSSSIQTDKDIPLDVKQIQELCIKENHFLTVPR